MAQGFQESIKPDSDIPTASKECFKFKIAVAMNKDIKLASMHMREAFLQAKDSKWRCFCEVSRGYRKEQSNLEIEETFLWSWKYELEVLFNSKGNLMDLGQINTDGDEAFVIWTSVKEQC